jgi:hypothetical protein
MSLDQVRAVADAVLYEGYLLYPYRATARKNQARWQFGVLGPPGAADAGVGEEPTMAVQCLLAPSPETGGSDSGPSVTVHLRFLQLQTRTVQRYDGRGHRFEPVDELVMGEERWLSWDEAVEQEVVLGWSAEDLRRGVPREVEIEGHKAVEQLSPRTDDTSGADVSGPHSPDHPAGRIVRRRQPLQARVTATATEDDGFTRLEVRVGNLTSVRVPDEGAGPRDMAIRASLIGTHFILEADGARFVSVIDPPPAAAAAARRCTQHRCWPVLAGERPDSTAPPEVGEDDTFRGSEPVFSAHLPSSPVVLGSPIILYDFPEVAEQSAGALFDSTEIDEILTLRVMTMTDEEKAEARATDARAREIIDRCDHLSPSALQHLHGILRNPHAERGAGPLARTAPAPLGEAGAGPGAGPVGGSDLRNPDPPAFGEPGVPWWDPAADEAVRPEIDTVAIDGVPVSKGSLVRVHPSRRADAQDLFFAGRVARVSAVLSDVDGGVHVALVLADDPAADLHDWYGRFWYFAPDELEPLPEDAEHREESRS